MLKRFLKPEPYPFEGELLPARFAWLPVFIEDGWSEWLGWHWLRWYHVRWFDGKYGYPYWRPFIADPHVY